LLAVNALRPPDAALVARVERLAGGAEAGSEEAGYRALAVGAGVSAGAIVATRDGQIALRLSAGGSLRLGPDTRIELVAAREVELLSGKLYFDSEDTPAEAAFVVNTAAGSLRDIGTQFVASIESGRLEVGVRDGRVAIVRDGGGAEAGAGERLVVPAAGAIRRDAIATYGGEWSWVESIAPPFDCNGHTLIDCLTWISEQTGRKIVFDRPATESFARQATLRGSIDFEPLQKLAAAVAVTGLSQTIDGDTILISGR
jgi:hypothetical protein